MKFAKLHPNTDTDQNVYTDVSLGFQACGLEQIMITEVTVNGVNVPPLYMVIGDDIDIDLSMNTNPNIGLVDYDGDGFFDDLPGGNAFRGFPDTDGFDLLYGQTAASNPTEVALNASGSVVGYDFGKYSSNGAPIAGTNASIQEVTKFVAQLAGPQIVIEDFEFVPGSAMFSSDGGASYAAVPDGDVDLTLIDQSNAELTINAGSTDAQLCYKYQLELDDCNCGPAQFVAVTQQVVSTCTDCEPDCDIVKGCRNTLFRVDPECTNCPCIAEYHHERSDRRKPRNSQ